MSDAIKCYIQENVGSYSSSRGAVLLLLAPQAGQTRIENKQLKNAGKYHTGLNEYKNCSILSRGDESKKSIDNKTVFTKTEMNNKSNVTFL